MSLQHILQLNHKGVPCHAYYLNAESKGVHDEVVNGWDALAELKNKTTLKSVQWTVMLPATWVYQSQTTVPSKSTEVLKQSIPFAVEEELSNDIDDNHIAFKVMGDNQQKVAVISKNYLSALKEQVQKYNLAVDYIISEEDFCPKVDDTVTVWLHKDHAVLSLGLDEILSMERDQVAAMLPVFAGELKYIQSNEPIQEAWLESGLEYRKTLKVSSCFDALNDRKVVNIMPTDWLKSDKDQTPKTNKRLIVLVTVLMVSWIGISAYKHISVNQQLESVKNEQLILFSERFGDASGSELADPFGALRSRMQRVNQSSTVTSPLLSAIQHLGEAYQNHRQKIDIYALRMVDQKLEIQITADSMTMINSFQQSLQQAALGFKVLIGVNEQDAGRFKSVITMEQL